MEMLPSAAIAAMAEAARRLPDRSPFECIALLLQGGGALGSYQAGVYAALAEAELLPDWVAGSEPEPESRQGHACRHPRLRRGAGRHRHDGLQAPCFGGVADQARNECAEFPLEGHSAR